MKTVLRGAYRCAAMTPTNNTAGPKTNLIVRGLLVDNLPPPRDFMRQVFSVRVSHGAFRLKSLHKKVAG